MQNLSNKNDFDTVKFFRKVKSKLSKAMKNMSFEERKLFIQKIKNKEISIQID